METNDTIRQALESLHSEDSEARAAAIDVLGAHQYAPAVPQLLALIEEVDPGTSFIIIKALGRIGDAAATPALLEALRGADVWRRAAATGALINIGEPAVTGLIDALRDEDKAVRRAAAKALGKIGAVDAEGKLLRALSVALLDVDDGVRQFAAEALGRLDATTMVAHLDQALRDDVAEVRIAAFKALSQLDTPEAQIAMRNWVKDS